MNDDLRELLASLTSRNVEFLLIGAHAVGHYSRPRFTQDVDLWVNPTPGNVERLRIVLEEFGAPIDEEGARSFLSGRRMIRLGAPPNMVDILNFAGNQTFESVWARRSTADMFGVSLSVPSRDDLIEMKLVAGRPQDLTDISGMVRADQKPEEPQ